MDQERQRIQDDLRGLIDGEVRCDDVFTQLYACDASIYELRPLAVVRPRRTADVVACVRYASENEIPIHARGAGTGLAGESLGPGLMIDFSFSMRRVLRIDEDRVRVQPGVVLGPLNEQLSRRGRLFGPDPATAKVTTMGSVLAIDGSGSHWLKYGSARDHVESIQVVLADGEVVEASRHDLSPEASEVRDVRLNALLQRLYGLLEREKTVIEDHQPKSLVNRCGYRLDHVLSGGILDLPRLLVGSEGTLGLFTEATVKTCPLPQYTGLALLFFDRLQSAARAALEVRRFDVSACDLLDRRLLSLARESDVRYDVMLPSEAEAILLIEQQADDASELKGRLDQITHHLRRRKKLAFDARIALDRDDMNLFWRLCRYVVPTLYRLKGSERPLPFVEDIAVPPESLADFLTRSQNVLKKHQVIASLFAHAAHGQVHLRPFLDLGKPEDVRRMHSLARDLYQEVLELGGTISGEHGDGLSRSWFLHEQYGSLYKVFRDVKRIFDPQGLFNPGKIVGDVRQPLTQNLRTVMPRGGMQSSSGPMGNGSPGSVADMVSLQLNWNHDQVLWAARECNGCGRCRTLSPLERMCPIFRFAPAEESSPRAKANLMRAAMTGTLDPEEMGKDQLKEIADLCVNCHQCRLECPASVDIPKLMLECKAQHVALNGLPFSDWVLSRLDVVSSWASRVRPLANWSLRDRRARWLLDKMLGIAQGRKLPKLARRSFIKKAHRDRLTRPSRSSGRKVLYFVDVYANWYDTDLADTLVAVLRHNGITVFVHPKQKQSGMAMLTMGAVEKAKQLAAKNVAILADAVRQGYHIVTTEPAAAVCLIHEYPKLIHDDDIRLVSENTSEACAYLWKIHQQGKLELDFRPVNATLGYHEPCHIRSLAQGTPGQNLLRLVPGLKVVPLDKGCSGMAGTYGLKKENYRSSLRAGWDLISAMRQPVIHAGASECSACKLQMEQGTTKPTIHPLKILGISYGLTPHLESALIERGEELSVT